MKSPLVFHDENLSLEFRNDYTINIITGLERSGQDEKALQTRQPPSRMDPLSNIARFIGAKFFGLFQPQFIPYQQQYAPGPPGPPGKLIY
jgi:hypothetical protein